MSERENSLAALRAGHEFPGAFSFKAIGPNTPEFVAAVAETIARQIGPAARPQIDLRESSGGRHQSVTVTLQVASAEQVLDAYAALGKLPGVRFML